jgi:GTP-binding protein
VAAGIPDFNIGDTLVDLKTPMPLPPIAVEQPTMSITLGVNRSPFKGKSGAKYLTSANIRERLARELEVNVALRVQDTGEGDTVQLFGRGLLHLTVLIETMRREGFELMVGPPKVLYREEQGTGAKLEPFEVVDIDLPEEYSGAVIDLLSTRKGNMLDMGSANADGMIGIQYEVPTRGMVGVKSRLMTATRGLAVMTATFGGYKPYAGDFPGRNRGNLLSHEQGTASAYALEKAQVRGTLFTKPNDEVYEDQIIGIHASTGDLKVNVCKMKQLTNFRTVLKDDATILHPPKVMTLEDAVEYIVDGEFVEITPDAIRVGMSKKQPKHPGLG